jgi:hypothetical protein
MAKLTPEARAALKSAHGEVITLTSKQLPAEEFAFKRPTAIEFDVFLATVADRTTKVGAHRQLARDLLVHPSPAEWDAMAERLPGLAHTFGNKLAERSGLDADVTVGKD